MPSAAARTVMFGIVSSSVGCCWSRRLALCREAGQFRLKCAAAWFDVDVERLELESVDFGPDGVNATLRSSEPGLGFCPCRLEPCGKQEGIGPVAALVGLGVAVGGLHDFRAAEHLGFRFE